MPRVDSSFLSYYHDDARPPPMAQHPQHQQGYAFQQPNARQESRPVGSPIRPPQPVYRPQQQPQPQAQRGQRPYLPNIQVSRPASPPKAAFAGALPQNAEKLLASPSSRSPTSPQSRKGSAAPEEDDRYGSVVGSQSGQMDFWKRFSMTLHDKEMEEKGLKTKQNAWLNKQFEGARKWKIIIWSLAIVILIVIGATLAWHFTRPDRGQVTQPTTHDFGLSPSTTRSANPLRSLTINAGPSRRTALPVVPAGHARRDRMHRQLRPS